MPKLRLITFTLLALSAATAVHAEEKRYVSDELNTWVRSGPGDNYRLVGTINANHAWWYPEMDTASHGFELVGINCCMDKYAQCWICGASQLRGNPMVVYKATEENSPFGNPVPCDSKGVPIITSADDARLKEWLPVYEGRE